VTDTCSRTAVEKAVRVLRQGGIIAYPTETYYGLGVDPFNKRALQRLFHLKKRSAHKPILVLVEQLTDIALLAGTIPTDFHPLMTTFWPGSLTLVFPARYSIPAMLTGGTNTVGIRQSPHPCAQKLLKQMQGPVTGTSANLSGEVPATTARQIEQTFGSKIDFILDGGTTPGGQGSTLVGFGKEIFCIREGKIPFARIRSTLKK